MLSHRVLAAVYRDGNAMNIFLKKAEI